jgi:hypothetical protein
MSGLKTILYADRKSWESVEDVSGVTDLGMAGFFFQAPEGGGCEA